MTKEKAKYITKAYGIKLIKPVGVDEDNWEFAGKVLSDLDYVCSKVKNKAVTRTYLNVLEKLEYENMYGKGTYNKYLKSRYGVHFEGYLLKQIREDEELYNHRIAGEFYNRIGHEVYQYANPKIKEVLKGNSSLMTFKRNQPIPISSGMIKLTKENNRYYAKLSLLNQDYAKDLGRKGRAKTQIKFLLSSKGQEKVILDRLTNGEYSLCDSHIHRKVKNGKVNNYLIVAFKFVKQENNKLIPNKILGVDMGVVYPAYMAVSDSKVSGYINGGEIEKFRKGIEARRNSMRNQLKYQSENRIGHGSKIKLKPLEKLESKVSNFKELTNHRYAKYIVEFALKHNCSIIQMEDLKGISLQNSFLKTWSYYSLQEKIMSKANEKGIEVKLVNPKYTSQRCYKCGHIDSDNRKSQDRFECCNCGHKDNADRNAARNLSVLNIDEIIKKHKN